MPPSTPNGTPNPYGFITDQDAATRKGGFSLPTDGKQRMMIFGALALVVIILIAGAYALVFSGKGGAGGLVDIAARQSEMIRVADIGIKKAKSPATKNFATNTKVGLSSDQAQLTARIKAEGTKLSSKQLVTRKNTGTDTALTKAEQSNNFDAAFQQEMANELTAYQQAIKEAYDHTSSAKSKSTQ